MKFDHHGRRVTILGLGHFVGGVAAARWLARQGAIVTVTDLADENALADSLTQLADVPIAAIHLGGHREEDFCHADLVVVNPAVRPTSPWLKIARRSGARLCTEIELFMENCPARIIGVTGSNGKSTTAAIVAAILNHSGSHALRGNQVFPTLGVESGNAERCRQYVPTQSMGTREILKTAGWRTFLGGNIGGSLLEQLPQIGPDDWVVLEISSFQLWHFTPSAKMPHIAVVTGCSPNHLDWHGSYADYVAAKQRILTGQTPEDYAVLNMFDAEVASWAPLIRGRKIVPVGDWSIFRRKNDFCEQYAGRKHGPVPLAAGIAPYELAHHEGDRNVYPTASVGVVIELPPQLMKGDLPALSVPGEHNRVNAACAAAAALAAGCRVEDIRRGLEEFRGLPQRLEWFATVEGRRFYNDSTATTPESTVAALRSLDMAVWLLAGGKSKGFDFRPLVAEIVQRANGVAFFGSVREELFSCLTEFNPQFPCTTVETMEEALHWCWARSRPGEAIVLSPACASTDQFRNFQERGQRFVELVRLMAVGGDSSRRL